MSQFFISCAPSFELELVQELKSVWFEMMDLDGLPTRFEFPEFEMHTGGVQGDMPEHLGFQINLFSKLANRVLLRIHKFEARYFDQLEKEFKKIEFEKWLEPQDIVLKIETHKSRINNQKSIEESLTKILSAKKFPTTEKSNTSDFEQSQLIYVRIEKDVVFISLDTSGEHLHRRGYSQFRGEAPLREVFAAYMFKQLQNFCKIQRDLSLIDPFAGSGTILFEAQCEKVPLFKRPFSWLQFKNRPKMFKSDSWINNYKWLQHINKITCVAIDNNQKSIENLRKNESLFNQLFPNIDSRIQSFYADSEVIDLGQFKKLKNLWLVTNPPYGHRLSEGQALPIIERFASELDLSGLVVIHPDSWSFKCKKLRQVSKIDFKNQGLKLKLSVFISL